MYEQIGKYFSYLFRNSIIRARFLHILYDSIYVGKFDWSNEVKSLYSDLVWL